MADEQKKDEGAAVPPKLDLRKSGVLRGHVWVPGQAESGQEAQGGGEGDATPAKASASPAEPVKAEAVAETLPKVSEKPREEKSGTLRIKLPDDEPLVAEVDEPEAAEPEQDAGEPVKLSSKRETARIPLEAATVAPKGETGPVGAPKTIRIKPRVSSSTIRVGKPAAPEQADEAPAAKPVDASVDDKRKTSRIPLEAALAADAQQGGVGAGAAPKTIRLKRPADAATIKLGRKEAPDADAKEDDAKASLTKTARLDMSAAEEDSSPTRRKTIKVKRPTQRAAGRSLSVARPTAGAAPRMAGPVPMDAAGDTGDERVSWVFPVIAIAAMIVSCVVLYVFAAQAFGPKNASLTQLSYGAEWLDLAWPGKLPRQGG